MQNKIDQSSADIAQLKSERDALMVKNMELGEEIVEIKKQLQILQQQDVRSEWEKTKQERDELVTKNVEMNERNIQSLEELTQLRKQVNEYEQQRESWKKEKNEEWKGKWEEIEKIAEEWKKKHETDTNELRSENNALKKKNKSLQSALTLFIQQNNKQEPFSKENKGKSLTTDFSTEEKVGIHDSEIPETNTTTTKNSHPTLDTQDSTLNSQSKKPLFKSGGGNSTDIPETSSGSLMSTTATNHNHSNDQNNHHNNKNTTNNEKRTITNKFMSQISKTLKLNRNHSEGNITSNDDKSGGGGFQNSMQIQHLVTSLSDIIREKEEIIEGLKESKHVLGLKVLKLEEDIQKISHPSNASDTSIETQQEYPQPTTTITTTTVSVD